MFTLCTYGSLPTLSLSHHFYMHIRFRQIKCKLMPKVRHECKCKFVNISCQFPLEIYMQHSPGGLVVEPSEAVSTLDDLRGGLFRRRASSPYLCSMAPTSPCTTRTYTGQRSKIYLAGRRIHPSILQTFVHEIN